MKKISIVTPSYNQAAFIERAILSVKNQNYPNYEHIIVDCSNDETVRIVKKYPEVRLISKKERVGLSAALNMGFRTAQGDIIGWINSDDAFEHKAFKTAADYLESHPEADMVYSDCRFIDENDKELAIWHTAKFSYFRNLNYFQMIPQQTIFFRKEVFEKVGYMDERFHFAIDYDFFIRVSKKCKIVYLPGVILGAFRLHSSSKTMSQRKKFEPEVRLIKKEQGAVLPYFVADNVQKLIGIFKKRL